MLLVRKVGEYISLFAHYHLESCCNRKIYINVIDEGGDPVLGQKVIIEWEYKKVNITVNREKFRMIIRQTMKGKFLLLLDIQILKLK